MVRRYLFPAILAAIVIAWFALLGHRDLIDPDEGRYAEIPREMLASGDWITPRIDGLKYFEKPPLQYWATAAVYKVFGLSPVTARLFVAVLGLCGAVWVGYVAAKLYGENTGYYAFVFTLTSLLYAGCAHYLTLDTTVSACIVFGIGSLVLAQQDRSNARNNRNWMLLGWAALALAVLAKGLIGVLLPAGAAVIYSIWQRDWAMWRHLHIVKGSLLFLLIAAPWFIVVSYRNEEFLQFFFIHEHWQRYTTPIHGHDAPFYYFVLIFVLSVCPWLCTSVASLVRPSFKWRVGTSAGQFDAERLLWVYVAFVLLFFSFSHSKLGPYILPMMPVIAILAAKRVAKSNAYSGEPWVMLSCAIVLGALGLMLLRIGNDYAPIDALNEYQLWILSSAALLFIGTVILFWGRSRPKIAVSMAGLCTITAFQLLLSGFQALAPQRTAKQLADVILERHIAAETPIYMVRAYAPSLFFYLQRTATMVAYSGELELGINAEPEKTLATPDAFAQQWHQNSQALAVIANDEIERYRALNLPLSVVWEGPRMTLFSKLPIAAQNFDTYTSTQKNHITHSGHAMGKGTLQ